MTSRHPVVFLVDVDHTLISITAFDDLAIRGVTGGG
jgi:hypothetical protein